jgi:hypothetical protein
LLVRVHRRRCGWISRASRLRNRRRTVDKGQQGYRRDQLSHNRSPSWDPPYRNHGEGKLDRQAAASLTFCSDAPARGAQGGCLARRCRAYGRPDCTKELPTAHANGPPLTLTGLDVTTGAASYCSMGQFFPSGRCEHCGGLMVLVMPIDGKGPAAIRCLECDRVDPLQLPWTAAWLASELRPPK